MAKTDKSVWNFEGTVCGNPPVLQTSKAGKDFIKFSVSVHKSVKKQDGTFDNQKIYVSCVGMSDECLTAYSYLQKGTRVELEGNFWQSTYTDKTGKTCIQNDVFVNKLDILSTPAEKTNYSPVTYTARELSEANQEPSFDASGIPF